MDIQLVFDKIREISARHMEPRPFVVVGILEQELQTNITTLGPYLVKLKNMRLIIFNRKMMTSVKLTLMGASWLQNSAISTAR